MGNGYVKSQGEILAETMLEEQDRAKKCLAKIEEATKEFNCIIEPVIHLTKGRVDAEIKVTPLPRTIKIPGVNHG